MRRDAGVALLEVLVALTILAVAGSALTILAAEQLDAVQRVRARAEEIDAAEEVLARLTLRDARALSLRLGVRAERGFVTRVARPRPGLYRLSVARDNAPDAELMVTVVHRPGVE